MDTTSPWKALLARVATWASAAWTWLVSLVSDKGRAVPLLLLGIATLWLIATPNPITGEPNAVKVGLLAWLICKESTLAYLGYWIDRLLHPRSRPGDLRDIERMAAEKRRAFIVCAAMLAGGLFQ